MLIMKVAAVILLASEFAFFGAQADEELCNESMRSLVENATLTVDGLLREDGIVFENGTFWHHDSSWWTCPCLGKDACLRICWWSEPIEKDSVVSLKMGNDTSNVTSLDHFTTLNNASVCDTPIVLEEQDEYLIHLDGKLEFFNSSEKTREPEQYCVFRENSADFIAVCLEPSEPKPQEWRFIVYPPIFMLSAVCLLLTLLSHHFAPERKTLHSRTFRNHSAALLFMYILFTANYIFGARAPDSICRILAYTTYFFLMASFFWLNVMCFDIFITFRSITQEKVIKYWQALLYAWGLPVVLVVIVIILNITTKGDFSPTIGNKTCWFGERKAEFIYFHGPVLILLVVNLIFFGLTIKQLLHDRAEAKRTLQSQDSQIHSSRHSQQSQDKFKLFFKLFMLMGCTWFMEFISWAVGGSEFFWYFTDIVNALRGVLIFWFSVWSKKSARDSLISRATLLSQKFIKQQVHPNPQDSADNEMQNATMTSSCRTSTTSLSN